MDCTTVVLLPILFMDVSVGFASPISLSSGRFVTRSVLPKRSRTVLALRSNRAVRVGGRARDLLRGVSKTQIRVSSAVLGCRMASGATPGGGPMCGGIRAPQNKRCTLLLDSKAGIRLGTVADLHFPIAFSGNPHGIRLRNRTCFRIYGAKRPFVMYARNVRMRILKAAFGVSTCPRRRCRAALMGNSIGMGARAKRDYVLGPSRRTAVDLKGDDVRVHVMSTKFCAS